MVVQRQHALEMLARLLQLTQEEAGPARLHVALQQQPVVAGGGAKLEDLFAERQGTGVLGSHDVVGPQAVQGGHAMRRVAKSVAKLPAQLPGALVTGLDLGRRVAPDGHVGGTERQAELQLHSGPLWARGKVRQQVQAGREVGDRLGVGRGAQRALPGVQPARHRLGHHAGLGVMVRQQLRRGLDRGREVPGQRLRDVPVILPAAWSAAATRRPRLGSGRA